MNSELWHHGILGMKWGKRNGPPYPLGSSQKSSAEKRHEKASGETPDHSKLKTAAKIGAVAVGTALVAYGAYKLSDSGVIDDLVQTGMNHVNDVYGTDIELPFKRLPSQEDILDTVKAANPAVGTRGGRMNCVNTCIAAELRQRGWDVIGTPNIQGAMPEHLGEIFDGIDSDSFIEDMRLETPDLTHESIQKAQECYILNKAMPTDLVNKILQRGQKVQDEIGRNIKNQYPEKSRGIIFLPGHLGGHAMYWINDSGSVHFYNPQNASRNPLLYFGLHKPALVNKHTTYNKDHNLPLAVPRLEAVRLDNLTPKKDNLFKAVLSSDVDVLKPGASFESFDPLTNRGKNFVMTF